MPNPGPVPSLNPDLAYVLQHVGYSSPAMNPFIGLTGPVFNVCAYGADSTGGIDATTAINDAITDASAQIVAGSLTGAVIFFPQGKYLVNGSVTVTESNVHLLGAGVGATRLIYNPTDMVVAEQTLFRFGNTGTTSVLKSECSLRGMKLQSSKTDYTNIFNKIAIDIWNMSNVVIGDVIITEWASKATTCVGLRTNGREFLAVRSCTFRTDRPIHIRQSPVTPLGIRIDLDQSHFEDLHLNALVAGQDCIVIDPGAVITNLTFDGYQSWEGGRHGLYWNDTSTVSGTSSGNVFQNVRREQSQDASGYLVYVSANGTRQSQVNLTLLNCTADPRQKGFYFRHVLGVNITGSNYVGTSTALDCRRL